MQELPGTIGVERILLEKLPENSLENWLLKNLRDFDNFSLGCSEKMSLIITLEVLISPDGEISLSAKATCDEESFEINHP
jgi:hypothetical protein